MDIVTTVFLAAAIAVLLSMALCAWMAIHDKAHRLWWTVSATLLGLGIACFIARIWIGAHVDDEGILREPFALIPIGYLLSVAGVLSVLLRIILNRLQSYASK